MSEKVVIGVRKNQKDALNNAPSLPSAANPFMTQDDVPGLVVTTGWASYVDTVYTNLAPFSVLANTDTVLPNNSGTIIESQKPADVDTFYYTSEMVVSDASGFTLGETILGDSTLATAKIECINGNQLILVSVIGDFTGEVIVTGQTSGWSDEMSSYTEKNVITGRNGDNLDVMLYLKAAPTQNNQFIDIWIDIAGAVGELYRQTFSFPRGTGVERGILYGLPSAYTLNTWEANGGQIKVNSNFDVACYDITLVVDRSHKAI